MLNNLPRKQRDKINISGNMWEQVTNVSTLGEKNIKRKILWHKNVLTNLKKAELTWEINS